MDHVKIRTAQNVNIEYELASVGDRILATLIDYLFFLAYIILLIFIIQGMEYSGLENFATGFLIIMCIPVILYDLLCETFFQGKSFGKMIMKIQVVKLDGTAARFSNYLLRWILRIIDTRLFFGAIALLVIIINGKGQRIGDIAASTTVIKLKPKATLKDTILKTISPDYIPVFKEVVKLTDQDVAIIKEVLTFSIKNNNQAALLKLSQKIRQTLGVTTDLPDRQFLETVIADYNHFYFENN